MRATEGPSLRSRGTCSTSEIQFLGSAGKAGRGAGPAIAELQALGVARVSIGPALTLAVMAQIRRAAAEVLEQGTYSSMQGGLTFPEANALFSGAGREA